MNAIRSPKMIVFWFTVLLLTACSAPALSTDTTSPSIVVSKPATAIPMPPAAVGAAATPSAAEAEAWQKVQCLDAQSLQAFLEAFPTGAKAGDANLYLALYTRMEEIKTKREKSALVIPFDTLGDRWQTWKTRLPDSGGIGYFVDQSSMGIFSLPGCNSISMDSVGMPITPTGSGSIVAFRTDGAKLEYLSSIVIQCAKGDILHFGVIDGMGLVYLRGQGSVTLPDSKVFELP